MYNGFEMLTLRFVTYISLTVSIVLSILSAYPYPVLAICCVKSNLHHPPRHRKYHDRDWLIDANVNVCTSSKAAIDQRTAKHA